MKLDDKALKFKEVCEVLTIHRQTLWRLISDGHIKAVRPSPGRRAVMLSELNRYIEAMKQDGDNEHN